MLTRNERIIEYFDNYDGGKDIDMNFVVQMLSDEERAEITQKAAKEATEKATEKAEEDKKKAVEEAEEDKKKAVEEAREKAEKESMEKLFSWISKASQYLIAKNRSEDIINLTTNSEFRNQIFKELNLG